MFDAPSALNSNTILLEQLSVAYESNAEENVKTTGVAKFDRVQTADLEAPKNVATFCFLHIFFIRPSVDTCIMRCPIRC